jgi:uncharacterized protein YbjT (DUF2867 family)
MRLLVLVATGGTGRAVIRQAGTRGYEITAFLRSPQKLGSLIDRVTVRQGDPRSVVELQQVLPGPRREWTSARSERIGFDQSR